MARGGSEKNGMGPINLGDWRLSDDEQKILDELNAGWDPSSPPPHSEEYIKAMLADEIEEAVIAKMTPWADQSDEAFFSRMAPWAKALIQGEPNLFTAEWVIMMSQDQDRKALWVIAQDEPIPGVSISTVHLGINHGTATKPIWHETLITSWDGYEQIERHNDRTEAEQWHARMVGKIEEGRIKELADASEAFKQMGQIIEKATEKIAEVMDSPDFKDFEATSIAEYDQAQAEATDHHKQVLRSPAVQQIMEAVATCYAQRHLPGALSAIDNHFNHAINSIVALAVARQAADDNPLEG